MSNALVPVADIEKMATAVAKSGLFGVKTPEQAMALMLIAQAEGYHPAMAARDYHIIQGRPTLKADAMLARFQSSGGKVEWTQYSDKVVEAIMSHPQGGSITLSWTLEQAKSIGLVKGGSGWEKYPRAMLRARVISEGIRTVYPGCIAGTYTPEEVMDMPAEKDITPAQSKAGFDDFTDDSEEVVKDTLALYVPGKTGIYAEFDNFDDYKSGILKIAERIWNSDKLDVKGKSEKISELKDLNKMTFKKIGLGKMTEVLSIIAKASEVVEVMEGKKPEAAEV